jgi:hypothetical protein
MKKRSAPLGRRAESEDDEDPPLINSSGSAASSGDKPKVIPVRTFRIYAQDKTPHQALTWTSSAQRRTALRIWRRAVFAAFGESSRAIRVAWVLADWFDVKRGYAFGSDAALAQETGVPLNKLQETLTALDNGGAILRVHRVNADGNTQRHIYPSAALIPPSLGGGDTPQEPGGQRGSVTKTLRVPRSQLQLAALQSSRNKRKDES